MTSAFSSRRARQHALSILVFLSGHLVAQAGHTTQIEVAGHLNNDGEFHVVEIHHITIGKGYESDFRVFGLGADQSIVMKGITRISEDGTETPLVLAPGRAGGAFPVAGRIGGHTTTGGQPMAIQAHFKMFKSHYDSWETMGYQVADFLTTLGPGNVIGVSHSQES